MVALKVGRKVGTREEQLDGRRADHSVGERVDLLVALKAEQLADLMDVVTAVMKGMWRVVIKVG